MKTRETVKVNVNGKIKDKKDNAPFYILNRLGGLYERQTQKRFAGFRLGDVRPRTDTSALTCKKTQAEVVEKIDKKASA